MDYKVIHLPKEQWKGYILPIGYTTDEYYNVELDKTTDGYKVEITKEAFDTPVTHYPEEYDFPDKLYADHWEDAYAWGVIEGNRLVAAIETNPEKWSNRLWITELWVDEDYRHKGIAHKLMALAKEQLRRDRYRALLLETQSCNVNAIGFYMHEGFTLAGFDSCCYSNNDLQRREVRLNLVWFPKEKKRMTLNDIEIRQEHEKDYYSTELMTQRAFWNKHHMGCDEHYLVHKLRESSDYLPQLSRIAVKDNRVIGCIMYSKAYVMDGDRKTDVITFGPLCVDPDFQGCGVGGLLLEETMKLAASAGFKGIIIYGEPDYYPMHGFRTCDNFGITTPDGKNFDAFMGRELYPGAFKDIKGKFYESEVFEDLPEDKVEEYTKLFPFIEKQRFPDQWD
jgi:predicted N-acetyltransferase YhbS